MVWKNVRLSLLLLIVCGVIYPLLMTGISQMLFPEQADGSLMRDWKGRVIGSELIGQQFTDPSYFSGRISSIGYDASGSGSANYGPSNVEMIARTKADMELFLKRNPDVSREDIPADLLTNSGSGLDPHISPMAARIQVARIAQARGISEAKVERLVMDHTEGRQLGLFGEPRVNVLALNQELDRLK